MTLTLSTDDLDRTVEAAAPIDEIRRERQPWWPLVVRPLFIVVALVVLWRWVDGLTLDSIEQRTVNREYLLRATGQHVWLTLSATVLVLAVSIPLGIALTRRRVRPVAPAVLATLGVGQAIPAYGLMVLLSLWIGIGFRTATLALAVYSFLPVLRNLVTGLLGVDRDVVEAGYGMGMSPTQVLRRIELPLAVPLVLTGVRTALVIGVGVATLATFINAGGLGDIIINGIKLNRTPVLVTGSVLCACVALFFDWIGALAERLLSPRGLA